MTAEHDGRIVVDIVAECATLHSDPFPLHLAGPAGGTYRRGHSGQVVEADAVEFRRVLCGRGAARPDSVPNHALPSERALDDRAETSSGLPPR